MHTAVLFPGHCRKIHCQTSENLHLGEAETKRREKLLTALEDIEGAETETSAGITRMALIKRKEASLPQIFRWSTVLLYS